MTRLPGLDFGRAWFIVAVVGWHTQALGSARVLHADEAGARFPFDLAGGVYFNVLLLAVPFFLTSSLVLYVRAQQAEAGRFTRRLKRVSWLAAFWLGVWTLSRGIGHVDVAEAPGFVLSGGHSVFYFLVELVLLTVVVEVALRSGLMRRPRTTAALVIVGVLLPLLRGPIADTLPGDDGGLLAYWSPLNFLVYPFLAIAILQLAQRGHDHVPKGWLALGILAYAGLAAAEWATMVSGRAFATDATVLPPYGRPSLVLASGVITLALLGARREAPRVVRGLSDLSLGIYCVHPFLVTNGPAVFRDSWPTIAPRHWLLFLIVIALSAAFAYPLRRGLAT